MMHVLAASRRWMALAVALTLLLSILAVGVPAADAADEVEVKITVTGGGEMLSAAAVSLTPSGTASSSPLVEDPSTAGLYRGFVDPGTYTLSVLPPAGSDFEPYSEPGIEIAGPGPFETTVALFLPVDSDDPSLVVVGVSGKVSNSLGSPGVGVEVSLGDFTAVTDAEGNYAMAVTPGEHQLRVGREWANNPPAGWPRLFDITYRTLVTVVDGEDLVRDVILPFVPQPVELLRPDGTAADGYEVLASGIDDSVGARVGDALASWKIITARRSGNDGTAILDLLPGTYALLRADGGSDYPLVRVSNIELGSGTTPTLRFVSAPTLSGRLLDTEGEATGGRFRLVAAEGSGTGALVQTTSDGRFQVVAPESGGPYRLEGRALGTSPLWTSVSAPFDLFESTTDIGDIVVPRRLVRLCPVDEETLEVLADRTEITLLETKVADVPAGDLMADYTFRQQTSLPTAGTPRCLDTLLPADTAVSLRTQPDRYTGYYGRTETIETEPGIERFDLLQGRFDLLDDTEAVDLDMRFVNGLGVPLVGLPMNLRHLVAPFAYGRVDITDGDGRVSTRLFRESPHDVRQLGPGSTQILRSLFCRATIGGATPECAFSFGLDVGNPEFGASRYDLGTIVLPFVPVDVIVRGSVSQPLEGAALKTPMVSSCSPTTVPMISSDVCATSVYRADRPGSTNGFGRERLWLVPGEHQLTVTPGGEDLAAGYQEQVLTVTVAPESRGQSVFVVLQGPSPSGDLDPAPQVFAGGPYVVESGGTLVLEAELLAGAPESVTIAWDLDDDGTFESSGVTATFDASELAGPSTSTVRVQACDDASRCAVDETTVTVLASTGSTDPVEPVEPEEPVTPPVVPEEPEEPEEPETPTAPEAPVDPDEPAGDEQPSDLDEIEQPSAPVDRPAAVTVDCTDPVAGGVVTCVISGLEPNQTVRATVTVNPTLFDGLVTADGEGIATFGFDVPADLADGARLSVEVADGDGEDLAETTLTVAATSESSPQTPSEEALPKEPSEVVRPETETAAEDGATSLPRSGGPVDSLILIALVLAGLGFALVRMGGSGARRTRAGHAGGGGDPT